MKDQPESPGLPPDAEDGVVVTTTEEVMVVDEDEVVVADVVVDVDVVEAMEGDKKKRSQHPKNWTLKWKPIKIKGPVRLRKVLKVRPKSEHIARFMLT